jgi:O-Antigen ligase
VVAKNSIFTRDRLDFWLLSAFLMLCLFMGGGSRPDVQSLVILRPISVLVLAYALATMPIQLIRTHRTLLILALGAVLCVAMQLVPLPYSWWTALPGRDVMASIDAAAGLGQVARPIAMVPDGAWNALWSLAAPLAVLLLVLRLDSAQDRKLLRLIIGLGLFSMIMGVLQITGPPNGPLYLYRITNGSSPVGFFANVNHHAAFLAMLFPMIAAAVSYASGTDMQLRVAKLVSIACALSIIPILLATGSRAGLILCVMGLGLSWLIYRQPKANALEKRRGVKPIWPRIALGFGIIAIVGITALSSRAVVFSRLFQDELRSGLRSDFWSTSWDMTLYYLPFGSGFGSFTEVYQIHEKNDHLTLEFVPHVHNDWIEILLTGGLPAAVLLFALLLWIGKRSFAAFLTRSGDKYQVMARLGSAMILMAAIASFFDYPLRTTYMFSLMMVALAWLTRSARRSDMPET